MIAVLLGLQVTTYVGLGVLFLAAGQTRLGVAQLLLAGVQGVLFSGGVS